MIKDNRSYQVEIVQKKNRVNLIIICQSEIEADRFYDGIIEEMDDGHVNLDIETVPLS